MNATSEKVTVRGEFYLRKVRQIDGAILEEYRDANLIVNLGRNSLAQLLGGASVFAVDGIAFGEGTAAPALGDTALTNQLDKALLSVTYPATGQVAFNWSLETSEGNGLSITEFGLTNNGDLFARKTRAAIAKDNTFRLEGTWTIIF